MASREGTLESLTTTKIGEKGQLTVPKQFREDLGLRTGAPFAALRLGDGLVLLPEQQRFEHLCEQASAALTGAGLLSIVTRTSKYPSARANSSPFSLPMNGLTFMTAVENWAWAR